MIVMIANCPKKIKVIGGLEVPFPAPKIFLKVSVAVPAGHVFGLPRFSRVSNIKIHAICRGGNQVTAIFQRRSSGEVSEPCNRQ